MSARMNRQYYGSFRYKKLTEHVVVETFGSTITRLLVSTVIDGTKTESWFTLEAYNPDLDPDTDQSHRYDETNKLHFQALFLVFQVLMSDPEDNPKKRVWQAKITQSWPADSRLDTDPYPEHKRMKST